MAVTRRPVSKMFFDRKQKLIFTYIADGNKYRVIGQENTLSLLFDRLASQLFYIFGFWGSNAVRMRSVYKSADLFAGEKAGLRAVEFQILDRVAPVMIEFVFRESRCKHDLGH